MTDPIDVTPEMIAAGVQAWERSPQRFMRDIVADVYRAMHAAAPSSKPKTPTIPKDAPLWPIP